LTEDHQRVKNEISAIFSHVGSAKSLVLHSSGYYLKANQTVSIKMLLYFEMFQSSLSDEMEQRPSPALDFKGLTSQMAIQSGQSLLL